MQCKAEYATSEALCVSGLAIGLNMKAAKRALPILLIAAAIAATASTSVAQSIYRCEQNGSVTFTDYPCDLPMIQEVGPGASNPAPPTQQTVVGGGYENPYGPWRGQAQYQVTNSRHSQQSTHSVVPLMILVSDDGKVQGTSSENGCRLLGIATPGTSPRILNVDVTLSDCIAKDLNQRFRGSLVLNPADRSARLKLLAQRIGVGTALTADIKASLRR